MSHLIYIVGHRFERLVVMKRGPNSKHGQTTWVCQCDCGTVVTVISADLRSGKTKSCTCLNRELAKMRALRHGMTDTKPYKAWKNMKSRCLNERATYYEDYGGRGIQICDRWKNSFDAFWADMKPTYMQELLIGRKDVNGDYSPENCLWTDRNSQCRNRRSNRLVETPSGTVTIQELAEISGINYHTLIKRVNRGWAYDLLLEPPVKKTQGGKQ